MKADKVYIQERFVKAAARYAYKKTGTTMKEVQTTAERRRWVDAYATFMAGAKFGVKFCRDAVKGK